MWWSNGGWGPMSGILEPATRKELAKEMLNQMQDELKKQVKGPDGGRGNDQQKSGG